MVSYKKSWSVVLLVPVFLATPMKAFAGCQYKNPTVSIKPSEATVAPGTVAQFDASVTSNDLGDACGTTSFEIELLGPDEIHPTMQFTGKNRLLDLAPGHTQTFGVSATPTSAGKFRLRVTAINKQHPQYGAGDNAFVHGSAKETPVAQHRSAAPKPLTPKEP